MEEIWKEVPGYEDYYKVSNLGNVESITRIIKGNRKLYGMEMKQKTINGYRCIRFSKNGQTKSFSIHQLVAMAFLGHKINGHVVVVDHINNIKTDNRFCNLQLITNRQNVAKDIKNKTSKYTGVSWDKINNKWRTDIKHNGVRINLGRYVNEVEAGEAYNNYLNTIT